MSKRRIVVLALVWLASMVVVSAWVAAQTDAEISTGNAMWVGVAAATLLTAATSTVRRK